ncbi:unnamed protein product [Amoebophrya sp. A120]|nr:unnamed protein product [Amoebophrya sp. A120]|eukprot:GSA120T00008366001.1
MTSCCVCAAPDTPEHSSAEADGTGEEHASSTARESAQPRVSAPQSAGTAANSSIKSSSAAAGPDTTKKKSSNSTMAEASFPIDLSGDGQLKKKILKEGTGAMPQQQEKVWAHYTGKLLDGTVFDSSIPKPHRKNGFDFRIGAGSVISGWDVGVASMKVGEKAELLCAPGYAYGAQGTPGGPIPPNATLVFEIELLHIGDEPKQL